MIPFVFAVHSHQPVGNFGWVFEKAMDESYEPFLELLSEHPDFKISLHYSGCLLDWIEDHRPAHLDILKSLVERGQVEILGGGYYEPIFTAIPERDARAQITRYFNHLEEVFGQRPRGLWLTERVWDPCLPALFSDLEVGFTLVDDSHFRYGGVAPADAWGPFLAEREGKRVILFPIDRKLRYLIPFHEPEESIRHIRERAARAPGFVACYGDDGEKFGVWPGTADWVFEKGWLSRFFKAMEEVSDEIRTVHFSEYLDSAPVRGRIYLPPASYEEMMEWVLPAGLGRELEDFTAELKERGEWERCEPFVRGGHWEMFLSKYEESNRMQKRMLLASNRLNETVDCPEEAATALLRSQCNCAYWHGVFGGLYLNYLRHALYQQMLEAEALAGLGAALAVETRDYDLDGFDEIIVSSPGVNAIVSPRRGGSLVALEYPAKRFSISNVMSRREETYHRKLARAASGEGGSSPASIHEMVAAKEAGLEEFLVYDRYPRNSLQDHVVALDLSLEDIEKERAEGLGTFAGAPYEVTAAEGGVAALMREDRCGQSVFTVEKELRFEEGRAGFGVGYRLISGARIAARFCVEWNLTLLAGGEPDRHCRINGETPEDPTMTGRGAHLGVSTLELVNKPDGFSAMIRCSVPAMVFRFPVETVSQSESGFERTYQGSAVWLTWPVNVPADGEWEVHLDFDFKDL